MVLEKTGLDFNYEPALALFAKAGCKVDGQRVYFPGNLVEAQIKKAPSQFTLYARNSEKNVTIGKDHIAFIPCYGTLSIGAPEMAVNTAATAQMGRFYNLPVRGGGALTDAKQVDSQAAYESMMSMMMATLSGINFVLHSAGILEGYITASYEKFIIDSEIPPPRDCSGLRDGFPLQEIIGFICATSAENALRSARWKQSPLKMESGSLTKMFVLPAMNAWRHVPKMS